jgi:sucrose phosphorylase
VKNLHGQKNIYYQVNATYYSALGEDDDKMLLARALQLFMPGKPQIWYLDLFVGKNDHAAVELAGAGGHKEINRTNLSLEEIKKRLQMNVVQKQLSMLRFRNTFPAFGFDAAFHIASDAHSLVMTWTQHGYTATLTADLSENSFCMTGKTENGKLVYQIKNPQSEQF